MEEFTLRLLRGRRADIRECWEALLRVERVNTPLANPDTLVFLIDATIDEVFSELRNNQPSNWRDQRYESLPTTCECGRNPFIAYFLAGRQALLEALILVQGQCLGLQAKERDAAVEEVQRSLLDMAQREIETFCALCQHRPLFPLPISRLVAR